MGQAEKNNRGMQLALILLCVLVFIFACCAIVFVALYFIKYGESDSSGNVLTDDASETVFTDANINYASLILHNADMTADPCEDFFAYACSNYVRQTPIPEKGFKGTWDEVSASTNWRIKATLEKEYDMSKLPAITKHAQDMYKSCMNEEKIAELGNGPLEEMLEFYGGFPAADPSWDPSTFDLTDLIAKTIRTMPRATLFMTVNVYLPQEDNSVYGMNVQQSYFFYPRYLLLEPRNSTDIMAYEQYATDMAVLLGADPAVAAADIKAMVDWEISMAPSQVPLAEYWISGNFEYVTVADLYSNFTDKIDWIRLLDTVFEQTGRKFQMNQTIEMHHIAWFERLSKKLETFGDTDYRAIANGLMVRMIDSVRTALPKSFTEARNKYSQSRFSASSERPRWETCAQTAASPTYTNWATARLYVEDNFDQSFKTEADNMMDVIKEVMGEMLDKAEWIDESTRKTAKIKLEKINEHIGFPDYILDEEKLNTYYPDLVTEDDTHLGNIRSSFRNFKLFWLLKLGKPKNAEEWVISPITFNAAYSPQTNTMIFPAVTFSPPIFHKDYFKVLNYAQAGFIMGHELSHGFDSSGRRYDETGRFNNWWSEFSNELFTNKSKCYVDQYNKFEIAGEQVKGENSLDENLADHGGLIAAYKGYHKWLENQGMTREPNLPGLKMTSDQTFFLGSAQWYCYTATERILKNSVSNRHTVSKYRLIGVLQNVPEFAKAFNCPAGSLMNPEKRCDVWV